MDLCRQFWPCGTVKPLQKPFFGKNKEGIPQCASENLECVYYHVYLPPFFLGGRPRPLVAVLVLNLCKAAAEMSSAACHESSDAS